MGRVIVLVDPKDLINQTQVAEILGISVQQLSNAIHDKGLYGLPKPAFKIGKSNIYLKSEIEPYAKKRKARLKK